MTRPASPATALGLAGLTLLALLVQTSVLGTLGGLGPHGVVPDLVLVVVVGVGLVRGARDGLVTGFAAGLLVDLAPPADHVAGRWALALMAAGHLAGRLDVPGRIGPLVAGAAGAACGFVAVTVVALTGLVLGDDAWSVGDLLPVVLLVTLLDGLAAAVLVPAAGRAARAWRRRRDRGGEPARALAGVRP